MAKRRHNPTHNAMDRLIERVGQKPRMGRFYGPKNVLEDIRDTSKTLTGDIGTYRALERVLMRGRGFERTFHLNTVIDRMLMNWLGRNQSMSAEKFTQAYELWKDEISDLAASMPSLRRKDENTGHMVDPVRMFRFAFPDGVKRSNLTKVLENALLIHASAVLNESQAESIIDGDIDPTGMGLVRDYDNAVELIEASDTWDLTLPTPKWKKVILKVAEGMLFGTGVKAPRSNPRERHVEGWIKGPSSATHYREAGVAHLILENGTTIEIFRPKKTVYGLRKDGPGPVGMNETGFRSIKQAKARADARIRQWRKWRKWKTLTQ